MSGALIAIVVRLGLINSGFVLRFILETNIETILGSSLRVAPVLGVSSTLVFLLAARADVLESTISISLGLEMHCKYSHLPLACERLCHASPGRWAPEGQWFWRRWSRPRRTSPRRCLRQRDPMEQGHCVFGSSTRQGTHVGSFVLGDLALGFRGLLIDFHLLVKQVLDEDHLRDELFVLT